MKCPKCESMEPLILDVPPFVAVENLPYFQPIISHNAKEPQVSQNFHTENAAMC